MTIRDTTVVNCNPYTLIMILLNFSHPLTDAQRTQVEALTAAPIARDIHLPAQFDHQQPFGPQLAAHPQGAD
jgi:hypothetical protein